MPESFQTTRHRQSAYNRPERKWLCGGECKDCPCFLGPDNKGNCQAGETFEGRVSGQCLPRRSGDRWLCTRPDTNGGDICESGPLPDGSCCMSVPKCRPKRSLRSKRGIFAIALTGATAVWLVAILSPDAGEDVDPMSGLDPGPLSSNHSFLETQCFRCHGDQEMSASAIIGLHGDAAHHRAIDDGKLCLACHDTIGGADGAFAFSAHTASELTMESKGSGKSRKMLMAAASGIASKHLDDGSIQCAACHQEHHGEKADIATLSDKQCQICHKDQFESFSKGHPEFAASHYPYSRRTAIRFDHYSHYQTHFPEKLTEKPETVPAGFDPSASHVESKSCTACHMTGKRGEPMAVKSFELACAACHEENTRAGEPLSFLAFPPINKTAIDAGLAKLDPPRSIGTWIEEPSNSFPWPTLQLLDKNARDAWSRLRSAGINPFDAGAEIPDDPTTLADMETVVWGVKELARDLTQANPSDNPSNALGQDELVRRLRENGFPDPEALVKGFPAGAFDAMLRGTSEKNYMARLKAAEMDDDAEMLHKLPPGSMDAILRGSSKGSYVAIQDEVAAKREGTMPPPVKPDEAAGPEAAPEATNSAPENFGDDSGETFGEEPAPPSGETFGEEPAPPSGETFGDDTGESFGNDTGETFGGDGGESFGEPEEKPDTSDKPEPPRELDPIDPVNWAARGGWYQQYGALYYRSTGHADPLLKNWLDALASRAASPIDLEQLKDGFQFLAGTESKASGSCLKCHAVDEIRDDAGLLSGARIRWRSLGAEASRHALTRYDHATHLLLADCRNCHQTVTTGEQDYLSAFPKSEEWDEDRNWSKKADPSVFQSNFKAIMKDTCADCHQAGKAGEGCIQCHFYHKTATGHADSENFTKGR